MQRSALIYLKIILFLYYSTATSWESRGRAEAERVEGRSPLGNSRRKMEIWDNKVAVEGLRSRSGGEVGEDRGKVKARLKYTAGVGKRNERRAGIVKEGRGGGWNVNFILDSAVLALCDSIIFAQHRRRFRATSLQLSPAFLTLYFRPSPSLVAVGVADASNFIIPSRRTVLPFSHPRGLFPCQAFRLWELLTGALVWYTGCSGKKHPLPLRY